VRRRSEKYVDRGSKYAHWIGLYLSFHSNWVLSPFVHGRLQNLQTSEVTFAHVITPLTMGRLYLTLGSKADEGAAQCKVFAPTGNRTKEPRSKAQHAIHKAIFSSHHRGYRSPDNVLNQICCRS